jgi:transcriptional regulator with XRE-family HTH domain
VDPIVSELRRERRRQGLSQAVVGGLAGITQAQVSRIERGAQTPSLGTVRRIADALGLSFGVGSEEKSTTVRTLRYRNVTTNRDAMQDPIPQQKPAAIPAVIPAATDRGEQP